MAQTQIADVIVPQEFTDYTVQNSVVSTFFAEAGVMVQNGVMASNLAAGSNNFTVPFWQNLRMWRQTSRRITPPMLPSH